MSNGSSHGAEGAESIPQGDIEVSVVMPCLDEAEGVGVCVEKALGAIRAMGVTGEVVVSDNGSTDGSPEIAEAAGARVVHEDRQGYGSAYLKGFESARGRYMVMGDADDTYPFENLEPFIEPLKERGYDLVMGTRLKGEILPGAMSWSHRWIGNPILSGMLKLLFRTRISDSHCGMRSFTREAYQRMGLRTTGMEFASEMVVNSLRERLKIEEIPITYRPRIGESKLVGMRDAWRHVRFMLLFSPSYLFQLPGILLMLIGLALVLLLGGGPREMFGVTWDYHPLLFGVAASILGYNLVLFDILAKAFSMGAGFARKGQWLPWFNKLFTLERGLILGGLVFGAGLWLEIKIVLDWIASGYGELMAVRGVVIGMAAMVIGLQTCFASFMISLLMIERR
ncbi:MAG: glycosyltransferase family 2 protein [Acidobacteriota bacterium]